MSDSSTTAPVPAPYGEVMTPRIDLLGLVVADMDRSLAFYRSLGLEIPTVDAAAPHVEAELPGGLRIAWDTEATIRSVDPAWTPPSGGHRIGLAFLCADAAEVDSVFARLVAAGNPGHLEPWDAVWGQRYAVVLDPDGNAVDLFAPLA
jgi:catechol 2,3-dioxygenase-like lactoylglutathione lyase family enzyme